MARNLPENSIRLKRRHVTAEKMHHIYHCTADSWWIASFGGKKTLAPPNRGGSSALDRLEYHTVVRTKLDTTLTAVGRMKDTPRKNHKPARKTGAVRLQRKDASLLKGILPDTDRADHLWKMGFCEPHLWHVAMITHIGRLTDQLEKSRCLSTQFNRRIAADKFP